MAGTWLREGIYSTIRISLYEPIKYLYGGTDKNNTPYYIKMAAGATAGLIGAAIANPSDLIKIRMQAAEGDAYTIKYHARQIH